MTSTSRFPGFDQLFSVGSDGTSHDFLADLSLDDLDSVAATRGDVAVRRAQARWAMGRSKPGQVVWTRLVGPVLFGEEVIDRLRKDNVSGWATYPVDLLGKDGNHLGVFSGLVVTGRCGPIDQTRCRQEAKNYPAGPFPVLRGLYFEESSWDGTDIFMPSDESAWVFVTRRAMDAIASVADNVRFSPLEDVEQVSL